MARFPPPCLRLISGFLAHPPDHLWGWGDSGEREWKTFRSFFFLYLQHNRLIWVCRWEAFFEALAYRLYLGNEHAWVTNLPIVKWFLSSVHLCVRETSVIIICKPSKLFPRPADPPFVEARNTVSQLCPDCYIRIELYFLLSNDFRLKRETETERNSLMLI